jgi:hypothetical protein
MDRLRDKKLSVIVFVRFRAPLQRTFAFTYRASGKYLNAGDFNINFCISSAYFLFFECGH